MNLFDLLT